MKVEDGRNKKPLMDIGSGECFACDSTFLVKTNECAEYGMCLCVDIESGKTFQIHRERVVYPLDAKVVIE